MFLRIKIKTTHWKAHCRDETPTHHIQWQPSPSIPPKSKIITLPIRHLTATCYARKQKSNIYKLLNERKCNWGILDSARLSFNYKGHSKISYKYAKLQGVLYPGGFQRNGLKMNLWQAKRFRETMACLFCWGSRKVEKAWRDWICLEAVQINSSHIQLSRSLSHGLNILQGGEALYPASIRLLWGKKWK